MNSRLRKLLLPLLRGYVAGKPRSFRSMESARQALFLLGKGIKKPSQGRLRRVFKRSTKNEETAKIREACKLRANGDCELGPGGEPRTGTELHHLEGGSGRLALQKVSNCMWACFDCHKEFHRHPEDYRVVVVNWAAQHGYPVPRRFRGPPKQIAGDAAPAAKEAVPSVHEPIARKAQ